MFSSTPSPEFLELSRCRDGELLTEILATLDAAKIPYRTGSTAVTFDITTIGSGSDPEVIVSVARTDFEAARAALEEEFLKAELPSDHYLLTFSNEELAEVLGKPSEWSPFDVAHARVIAKQRGVHSEEIQSQREQRLVALRRGKPASKLLLTLGWVFSFLGFPFSTFGGYLGVGVAWSICSMKERTPEGNFYTYDEASRGIGRTMLMISLTTSILVILSRVGII